MIVVVFTGMQRKVKKGVLRHAYWILNTIATVYSFIITFFYWTMLHDPGMHSQVKIKMMLIVILAIM